MPSSSARQDWAYLALTLGLDKHRLVFDGFSGVFRGSLEIVRDFTASGSAATEAYRLRVNNIFSPDTCSDRMRQFASGTGWWFSSAP